MRQGKLKTQRGLLMAQAGLFFFDGRDDDFVEFLQNGYLPGKSEVMPYNPAVLEASQRELEARRGKG
jgi:hypothetical protein